MNKHTGEPVAWVNLDDLYDLEAGEDGDVPYVVRGNEQPKNMPKSIPLYTTPPQSEARGLSQQPAPQRSEDTTQKKPWVGLTDEEIISMSCYDLEWAALIGEVQRKLKEKNT